MAHRTNGIRKLFGAVGTLMRRLILPIIAIITLQACTSPEQYSLDESIPRLQSPIDQIAYLRTKWRDGNHIETVFYDLQGRAIEKFSFGRSSLKELHFYEGGLQKKSIYYSHSDSSEPGYVSVDTVTREFDTNGRLVLESHVPAELPASHNVTYRHPYKRHLAYTVKGDTIVRFESELEKNHSQLTDIDQWERDEKNRLTRHYRLYVVNSPDPAHPDTIYHFSQKYAYDTNGRLKLAWFDSIYLGKSYRVPGPDTIWYHYNLQSKLSEEEHLYTTDMRNKREVDTSALSREEKESVKIAKNHFLAGLGMINMRHLITYKYEKFDPSRHGKLIVPTN